MSRSRHIWVVLFAATAVLGAAVAVLSTQANRSTRIARSVQEGRDSVGAPVNPGEKAAEERPGKSGFEDHERVGGWGRLLSVAEMTEFADTIAEVTVTIVTSATYNTEDGLFPADYQEEDFFATGSHLAFREIAVDVSELLKISSAYSDVSGFVMDESSMIIGEDVQESSYSPVGSVGMLFLKPVSPVALASPEPFRQRTLSLASALSVGPSRYAVMNEYFWFRYNGDVVIDPRTGEESDRVNFRNSVLTTLGQ